jgi:hypothetical protein
VTTARRRALFYAAAAATLTLISISAVGEHAGKGSQSSSRIKTGAGEGRSLILGCSKAAASTLNFAEQHGVMYAMWQQPPTWRVAEFPSSAVDNVRKHAMESLKGCPSLAATAQLSDPVRLLEGLMNNSQLSLKPKVHVEFQIAKTPEESGPPEQPTAAPPAAPPEQPTAAPPAAPPEQPAAVPPAAPPAQATPAPPAGVTGQPQRDLATRLTGQVKEIETRLDTLDASVAALLNVLNQRHPPAILLPYLQLVLVGLAFVGSTLAFVGMRRLNRTMPEPQLLENLRDEILRSRQRDSQAETLASETQRELSRIDAALRALRSEIGSLRSAPAPEQERLPRPPMPQPAPRTSEPMPPAPPNPGPRGMPTPSDDEWCAAYNDALRKQNLDDFRSRHGGVWTRIQDRTTRPASLIPVDYPPERGILDGFLYVPNGRSRRGWVFPGPNYYAARSAISTGQLRLEAFSGIFESQTGEVYALRQPATAIEGRTGITIENPGLIEL